MNEHEQEFVNAFIVSAKRSRYLLFLKKPNRRREILDRLNHSLDFDGRFAKELPPKYHSSDSLFNLLKDKGAGPTCYVIADESELDGQELTLPEAIDFALGHSWGVVLCCVPGRLAYYKMEVGDPSYLLERR